MRILGRIVLIVLAVAGLFWPLVGSAVSSSSTTVSSDPVSITDYQATFDVAADGLMSATESLTTEFPSGRHGIFRYFDTAVRGYPNVRVIPQNVKVTMDGAAVPVDYSWAESDRYYVAKVGDPNSYVTPGSHNYTITYQIPGALFPPDTGQGNFTTVEGTPPADPTSVFYWNVVANGWRMSIAQASVTVNLPSAASGVECGAGTGGSSPCTILGLGTQSITAAAVDLAPMTGMTLRAPLTTPLPAQHTLPWPIAFDPIFGRSLPLFIAVMLATVAAAAAGVWFLLRSREPAPGFPVMYAPPEGLGPVQVVYMAEEEIGDHAMVASLMRAADLNLVKLFQNGDEWTVQGITYPQFWEAADPVTRQVGQSLGLTQYGASITADKSVATGKILQSAQKSLSSATSNWSTSSGLTVSSTSEKIAKTMWLVCLVLAGVGFFGFLGPTMFGLPFAAFVIAGVGLRGAGVGTRRTETGRRLWSESAGFRRLLATPSAEDRFDFSARKDLFISYVPYAVAFGVADKWAEKYKIATGEEPPVPGWYPMSPYMMTSGLWSGSGGFDSFNDSLNSTIGAYEASQSSSSGGGSFGGGGFGGGGGGGGGGSW